MGDHHDGVTQPRLWARCDVLGCRRGRLWLANTDPPAQVACPKCQGVGWVAVLVPDAGVR